ncbi:DUF2235 domain-containing protein [Labrenzia sp. 011]|uniref:DUF2235 domain-containing protein n=1 Tax=Labrenzia sp. 011 TaxID=2171494 RepID=UPI000D5094E4|nr:DUF2235 domain-containing protein [Labrenzia sp. 011]PVB61237.1 DUF2235 domain-containing protein [Labrenzia sp. 011]
MVNLVVCCDGTWATPDNMDDGIPAPTNVVKIHAAISGKDASGVPQETYYHAGVGTEGGWWRRLLGGGIGAGLDRNIKSAYRWLAGIYQPGDRLFLFGFSRGAYTVRSLAGMISACGLLDLGEEGLPDETIWARVDEVFANYRRTEENRRNLRHLPFHNTGPGLDGAGKTPVHFLGVWDTVGSLGIPDELALLNLLDDPRKHAFHDTELSDTVAFARHAIAMDEPRSTFSPTLWTKTGAGTDVKQIWFPGAHSDVGGGYARMGLSDGALKWMIEEAAACGLAFREAAVAQIDPDPRDVLHDSVGGFYRKLRTRPRSVPCLTDPDSGARFHSSALKRHGNPPLTQAVYWPTHRLEVGQKCSFDIFAREKWNATGLFLKAGEDYLFTASGQWVDATIKCGPEGTRDGRFQAAEVVHVAASAWGQVEKMFKALSGNLQTDFWLTRREGEMPWFALVGVVANGIGAEAPENAVPHDRFLIGRGGRFPLKADGYLYAFANDAWQAYGNNRGSVKLTVERTG